MAKKPKVVLTPFQNSPMPKKPYTSKSLSAAIREVRLQRRLVKELADLLEQYAKERLWLAKLASKTPLFDNPLHAWEVEKVRDDILRQKGLIK